MDCNFNIQEWENGDRKNKENNEFQERALNPYQ